MKGLKAGRQVFAVLLCCLLSAGSVSAAQGSSAVIGTIQFHGNVLINGANSPSNATVFSGDTVWVPAGAASHGALLTTADGARIELRPNTSVSFVAGAKGTEVVLKQGTVLVQRLQDAGQAPKSPRRHGSGQAAVMVEGLLARSVDKGSGLFEVARQEKRVDVTAGRGAVEISGLVNGSVTVPAGKRATLEARPMTTGQEEPPPTGAGSISYAGIPAWGWFLIAMGGAGAIIGIILAVTGEESPSSP